MSSVAKTKRPMSSGRAKRVAKNSLIHIILGILVVIWLFPVFWIVMTSFRAESGAYTSYFFPKGLTFNNYTRLFTETTLLNFPRAFMNTLIIAIFSCLISTVFVLSVSYCMSRLRFKMRKPFMNIAMILGLNMLRVSLILIYSAGSGTGFYIAKGFFDTVPKSLTEAAILDGCNQFQVFYKIILPLSKPIVVYTILTAFLAPWLDFVFVKVIVVQTISIGQFHFSFTTCLKKSLLTDGSQDGQQQQLLFQYQSQYFLLLCRDSMLMDLQELLKVNDHLNRCTSCAAVFLL